MKITTKHNIGDLIEIKRSFSFKNTPEKELVRIYAITVFRDEIRYSAENAEGFLLDVVEKEIVNKVM